uniref:Uncharacterized protein n=1 Tax=Oryza barthii TaxID=65489 RepID=A0A0D3F3W4_9ORYZ
MSRSSSSATSELDFMEKIAAPGGCRRVSAEGKAGDVFELRRCKESPPPVSYSTSSRMPLP